MNAAIALAVALVGFTIVQLSDSAPRRTASTNAGTKVPVHVLGGDRVCQPHERIPHDTGFVVYQGGADAPAGPLRVVVQDSNRRQIAAGTTPAGVYGGRPLFAKIRPVVGSDLDDARLCIENLGTRQVDIRGELHGTQRAEVPRRPRQYTDKVVLRLDYFTADKKSWLAFAPEVARRSTLVKATFFGSWTFWVAMAALAALCLTSVLYAGRELSRED